MEDQLLEWTNDFGVAYADRNVVDPASRVGGFAQMLTGLDIDTALEVGSNRGHNIAALQTLGLSPVGIEPGDYARSIATSQGLPVHAGTIYDIPYLDGAFDLVFTSGVLIHVPPEGLLIGLAEMARVTSRYLLAVEYQAATEEEIPYRGKEQMLWRRDYRGLFAQLHGFTVIRSGVAPDGFERAEYVIAERSG